MTNNKNKPLPEDSAERKTYPLYRGLFKLFPHALAAVAHHTYANCKKHLDNPDPEAVAWDRNRSKDELDALLRHIVEGEWEAVAWRALAHLERERTGDSIYQEAGLPALKVAQPTYCSEATVEPGPTVKRVHVSELPVARDPKSLFGLRKTTTSLLLSHRDMGFWTGGTARGPVFWECLDSAEEFSRLVANVEVVEYRFPYKCGDKPIAVHNASAKKDLKDG
jgi:hypothetical protein